MTVNDVFPYWFYNDTTNASEGIFHYLSLNGTMPWVIRISDNYYLDDEYHGNVSGDKLVAPLVTKIVEQYDKHPDWYPSEDEKTSQICEELANVVIRLNLSRWNKLWATLDFNYNPIENYSMTETHTGTDTHTQTPTNWTETETQTPTDWKTKETQTPTDWKTTTAGIAEDNNQNSNAGVYGFNSSESVPTSTTNTESNSKIDVESSGTYETETEQSGTYQTAKTQSGTFETETDYNTTLTRTGNIGTVTAQDMITQEREIQMWNFFRDVVFSDIDKVLTLKVY